ncbi:MAG: anhydro-N-acetylmuramic acid kinase [Pseudomonadota bacterium]
MSSPRLFVGLISGTSADGVDCVLVRETNGDWQTVATRHHPFDAACAKTLAAALDQPKTLTLPEVGSLHTMLGAVFAEATLELLADAKTDPRDVIAVGSHGQTLFHAPAATHPFSLQIGCGATIAAQTGITTVNDFRGADLAVGGQGAPLAPLLHKEWFSQPGTTRGVLNLGGIANLSVLEGDQLMLGFDTGPANTLMDWWARRTGFGGFDRDGAVAASGTTNPDLLSALLTDPYFAKNAPKSTGREYFDAGWLLERLSIRERDIETLPRDDIAMIMSTLCDLSVTSIAKAIEHESASITEIIVCGGGVHNSELMRRLQNQLAPISCQSASAFGHDPDYIEASLFAWLAAARIDDRAQSLVQITGARLPVTLGAVHHAPGAKQNEHIS